MGGVWRFAVGDQGRAVGEGEIRRWRWVVLVAVVAGRTALGLTEQASR